MSSMRRILTILFMMPLAAAAAQPSDRAVPGDSLPGYWHPSNDGKAGGALFLRTNLLYDAVLLPSVGVEFAVGRRSTMVVNGTFNWLGNDDCHRYWCMATVDAEVRWWLGCADAAAHSGHHVGVYAAAYRYDIEFGGKGQMGDFNYGGGFSYGYAMPIGRSWSLDFTVGVGYIGGRYKEYEPSRDKWNHYLVRDEKNRQWVGPTKAEVTLVWRIGMPGRTSFVPSRIARKRGTAVRRSPLRKGGSLWY